MDEEENLRLAPEIRCKSFCQSVKGIFGNVEQARGIGKPMSD